MNCNEIEKLLPRYVEGDLHAEENLHVRGHLNGCERCTRSLALYTALEESLKGLKEELPSPAQVSKRVINRLGIGRRSIGPAVFWNFPVIAIILSLIFAAVTFTYRDDLVHVYERAVTGFASGLEQFSENFPRWIVQITSGETWVLVSIYIPLTLLIVLAGGVIAIRYAQR